MAETHDWIPTIILLLIMGLILANLSFEIGRGLDPAYVYAESSFFIIGMFLVLIFTASGSFMGDNSYNPSLFDSDRPLANWWARGIAALLLVLVFTGFSFATTHSVNAHSVIPIVNPYNSHALISAGEKFTVQGQFTTAWRTGAYAGFGEEIIQWAICTAIICLLLFACKTFDEDPFDNWWLVGPSIFIGCAITAISFTTAHTLSYGLNGEAYWSAFTFSFIGQLTNQIVGAPVSILAHFSHNFFVVLSYSIAFSIGGVAMVMLYKHKAKGCNS